MGSLPDIAHRGRVAVHHRHPTPISRPLPARAARPHRISRCRMRSTVLGGGDLGRPYGARTQLGVRPDRGSVGSRRSTAQLRPTPFARDREAAGAAPYVHAPRPRARQRSVPPDSGRTPIGSKGLQCARLPFDLPPSHCRRNGGAPLVSTGLAAQGPPTSTFSRTSRARLYERAASPPPGEDAAPLVPFANTHKPLDPRARGVLSATSARWAAPKDGDSARRFRRARGRPADRAPRPRHRARGLLTPPRSAAGRGPPAAGSPGQSSPTKLVLARPEIRGAARSAGRDGPPFCAKEEGEKKDGRGASPRPFLTGPLTAVGGQRSPRPVPPDS